jgi:hypothetical protein
VHLVSFIIKKFVTMHGHMNFKVGNFRLELKPRNFKILSRKVGEFLIATTPNSFS